MARRRAAAAQGRARRRHREHQALDACGKPDAHAVRPAQVLHQAIVPPPPRMAFCAPMLPARISNVVRV